MKKIRCAIYTRKSSEDGLEQEFNSLDAQYEACAAYIASQKAEGWVLLPERYDDGGIRPLERVPDAIRSQIHNNTALMIGLGLQGTPALVFEDSQGRWRLAPGVIGEEALRAEVFQINE